MGGLTTADYEPYEVVECRSVTKYRLSEAPVDENFSSEVPTSSHFGEFNREDYLPPEGVDWAGGHLANLIPGGPGGGTVGVPPGFPPGQPPLETPIGPAYAIFAVGLVALLLQLRRRAQGIAG